MSILNSILEATENQTSSPAITNENHNRSDTRWGGECHNIAQINGRNCVVTVNQLPWHQLGVTVEGALTAEQALSLAGLDWTVHKEQAFIVVNGQQVEIPNRYAIVRYENDTPIVLGSVGRRYELLQNREAFELIDSTLQDAGAKYVTAGALGNGSRTWLQAAMPDCGFTVGGDNDETKLYLMLANSHDGNSTLKVYPTAVRTVCQNTYLMSLADKRKGVCISHTKNMRAAAKQGIRSIKQVREAFDLYGQDCKKMANKPCDAKKFAGDVLDAVLFKTEQEQNLVDEKQKKRKSGILDTILNIHESDTCATNNGSVWSSYNAVTEYADHSLRYQGGEDKKQETRFDSILTGRSAELKEFAYERALEYVSA